MAEKSTTFVIRARDETDAGITRAERNLQKFEHQAYAMEKRRAELAQAKAREEDRFGKEDIKQALGGYVGIEGIRLGMDMITAMGKRAQIATAQTTSEAMRLIVEAREAESHIVSGLPLIGAALARALDDGATEGVKRAIVALQALKTQAAADIKAAATLTVTASVATARAAGATPGEIAATKAQEDAKARAKDLEETEAKREEARQKRDDAYALYAKRREKVRGKLGVSLGFDNPDVAEAEDAELQTLKKNYTETRGEYDKIAEARTEKAAAFAKLNAAEQTEAKQALKREKQDRAARMAAASEANKGYLTDQEKFSSDLRKIKEDFEKANVGKGKDETLALAAEATAKEKKIRYDHEQQGLARDFEFAQIRKQQREDFEGAELAAIDEKYRIRRQKETIAEEQIEAEKDIVRRRFAKEREAKAEDERQRAERKEESVTRKKLALAEALAGGDVRASQQVKAARIRFEAESAAKEEEDPLLKRALMTKAGMDIAQLGKSRMGSVDTTGAMAARTSRSGVFSREQDTEREKMQISKETRDLLAKILEKTGSMQLNQVN